MIEYTLGESLYVGNKVATVIFGDTKHIHIGSVLVGDRSEYIVCGIGIGSRSNVDQSNNELDVLIDHKPIERTLYLKEHGQ